MKKDSKVMRVPKEFREIVDNYKGYIETSTGRKDIKDVEVLRYLSEHLKEPYPMFSHPIKKTKGRKKQGESLFDNWFR